MRGFLVLPALMGTLAASGAPVSFDRDIRPLLEARCLKCHGAAIQLSKLDLRTREAALKGGARGPAIVPSQPAESRLYRLVSGLEKPAMPLDGALDASEIAALKTWIEQGAPWDASSGPAPAVDASAQLAALEEMAIPEEARRWWAFQRPVRSRPPPGAAHPVDAFLKRAMRDQGLKPGPAASRATLLRRAYLDLTGLPPSPVEAREFLEDRAPGAWERLIDRLLASPHYGERWGRHWLDVARYADSNGFEHDFDRPNAWRYRDYVIASFNRDTPYNVFLGEQISGDELERVSYDSLTATGFLRNYAKVGFREKDNPQFRFEYLDDMIATVGRGILGLTVHCARCHNHKFDPIPQRDYYRLQASLFGYVEVDHPLAVPEAAEAYRKKIGEVDARIRPLKERIRQLEEPYRKTLLPAKYSRFPAHIQAAINTPEDRRTPGQILLANQIIRTVSVSSAEVERVMTAEDLQSRRELAAEIGRIEKDRPAPIPVAMGITDGDYRFTPDGPGDEPAPGKGIQRAAMQGSFLHAGPGHYQAPASYFLIRGDLESRGSLMRPGFLTVVAPGDLPVELPPAHGRTSGRRLALARWLASPENPLTARVIVNRVWHHHFGRGLVSTLDNFGKMGERPTHPELLDWLALEFVNQGWSIKKLHRLLMTSAAYQRSSEFQDARNFGADPENRRLWRFRIQRLEAESVRDAILAVSGGLNRQMGGEAVFPKLQPEVLASMKFGIWEKKEDGPEVWRRSVYVYRKRGLPFPMFEAFDLPDQNTSCGARNVSTVPTQALTLLNDEFVLRQSGLFAGRIAEAAPANPARQVEAAYQIALSRPPSKVERRLGLEFLQQHQLADFAHVLLNLNEFLYIR
ncbi:MAG: DUF1553 domain-containing protein [Acidobacteria bacterium]|nr:DUF1553 domain-containing protein [Acidobacteriota bacterium]